MLKGLLFPMICSLTGFHGCIILSHIWPRSCMTFPSYSPNSLLYCKSLSQDLTHLKSCRNHLLFQGTFDILEGRRKESSIGPGSQGSYRQKGPPPPKSSRSLKQKQGKRRLQCKEKSSRGVWVHLSQLPPHFQLLVITKLGNFYSFQMVSCMFVFVPQGHWELNAGCRDCVCSSLCPPSTNHNTCLLEDQCR